MRQQSPVPPNLIWYGRCVDRSDPAQVGRVRVRIFGFHTDDETLIPTSSLPWAMPIMPANNASLSGVGSSPNGIMLGSIVAGYFADGTDCQIPIILGTLNQLEGPCGGGNTVTEGYGDDNGFIPGNHSPTGDGPPWLRTARGEIGTRENKGASYNPRILEYLSAAHLSGGDETPWCASFVAWCLKQNGIPIPSGAGAARSYQQFERLSSPIYGCLAVFSRGANSGHVGFYTGAQGGRLMILGGNQSNSVNIQGKGTGRLIGFYWPPGVPKESSPSITSGTMTI